MGLITELLERPIISHDSEHPVDALKFFQLALPKRQQLINSVFTENGFLKQVERTTINPYELPTEDLLVFLARRLMPIYKLVTPSLDGLHQLGFNNHDWLHILNVGKRAELIAKEIMIGKESETFKNIVIAVLGHDLGNFLDRKDHYTKSSVLLAARVPELDLEPQRLKLIEQAIQLHDEGALGKVIEGIAEVNEQIQYLRDHVSQEALVLYLADKLDTTGRSRATRKPSIDFQAIEQDIHLLLSLCFESTDFVIDEKIIWQIEFNRTLSTKEQKGAGDLKRFQKPDEPKIPVPGWVHLLHQKYGIPHSLSLWSAYMKLYHKKIIQMAKCSLALFPESNSFEIRMQDRANGSNGGTEVLEIFLREDINTVIEQMKTKYD